MKRKYADRSDWQRVLERGYAQTELETEQFKGYISLIQLVKVSEPLYVSYSGNRICIGDDGYLWLQQFPSDAHHTVTTMFEPSGKLVQWYIDISYQNGLNEEHIPWMDDLYLDIVVLPTGEIIQKDADELEDALLNGSIDRSLYNLARHEAARLHSLIKEKNFTLLCLAEDHKNLLLQKMQSLQD